MSRPLARLFGDQCLSNSAANPYLRVPLGLGCRDPLHLAYQNFTSTWTASSEFPPEHRLLTRSAPIHRDYIYVDPKHLKLHLPQTSLKTVSHFRGLFLISSVVAWTVVCGPGSPFTSPQVSSRRIRQLLVVLPRYPQLYEAPIALPTN